MNNKLVKTLSVFLTVIILLSVAPMNLITFVSAAEVENEIEWIFDGETLVITGTGELSSEYTTMNEWEALKKSCVNVIIKGNINAIGSYAFKDFSKLENVQLPDTVTEIAAGAFINTVELKNFVLPPNLKIIGENAFKGSDCFDGTDLVIPFSVDYIGLGAFADANVKSLTVPFIGEEILESEKTNEGKYTLGWIFGKEEFSNTENYEFNNETYYIPDTLKELKITKSVTCGNLTLVPAVEKLVFASTIESEYLAKGFSKNNDSLKEVYFENGSAITELNEECFMNCLTLSFVELPDNLTCVPYRAFRSCLSLETIDLPDTITIISQQTFFNCDKLSEITLPKGLIYINKEAFRSCAAIESIVIPSTVTRLGDRAFAECTNLKNAVLPENITEMGEDVFKGTPYAGDDEEVGGEVPEEPKSDFVINASGELISYVGESSEVIVPEGVKVIGEQVFYNRTEITSIVLPEGLLEISKASFSGCTGITELVVPDTVQKIGQYAFSRMTKLEKLTVPFIGMSANYSAELRPEWDYIEYKLSWWFSVDEKPENLNHLTITGCSGQFVDIQKNSLKGWQIKEVTLGKVRTIAPYGLANAGIEVLNFMSDKSVKTIGQYAFYNNKIKTVTLPDSVRRIKEYAFSNNEITEVYLNEGLEFLGGFQNTKIESIKIPSTVYYIDYRAFAGCELLEHVEISYGVKEIYALAFAWTNIKEIEIPESVTGINEEAFVGSKIERIVLPESLSYISVKTFEGCEFLKEVVIGGSVEEINSSAFADCSSLETVVIPDSVTSISDDAFTNSTENLVIYCNEGSYAQQYAVQNNIKYTTLVLEAIPNQTYTGKAIEPEVKAKANNKQLIPDKEYKISFTDNIESGVASVTAKGLGDFKHLIAKGKFTILPRQLNDVVVNYYNIAYYKPSGVKPKLSLYIGVNELVEGEHYEVLGVDKVKNVGVYNIAISGKGNLSGTKNFTLEVLPRSITVTKIVSTGDIKVTDSQYTLVEGVDYKVEKRTDENGVSRTYVVGIGNYTDETRLSIPNNVAEPTGLLKLFKMLLNLFSLLFGVFK